MRLQPNYLGLLQRLDELKHQLPRSERRIAETVLDNPEIVSYMRLNELAHAADVSIATVHRFCRSLGCDGFKELRQEISRSMSSTAPQSIPATLNDNSNHYLPNIIGEVSKSLNTLHSKVNEATLAKASTILNDADRAIMYTADEDFYSTIHEGTTLLYKAGLPCEPQLSERAMGRTIPTLKKNDLAIFVVTDRSPEPTNWMGSIKQLGGSSLSFVVGDMHAQQSADVLIELERSPANQYSPLIAQISLTILLTHLSGTVLPN